jgi:hypothetical protein
MNQNPETLDDKVVLIKFESIDVMEEQIPKQIEKDEYQPFRLRRGGIWLQKLDHKVDGWKGEEKDRECLPNRACKGWTQGIRK